jgi:predicted nucleotidyltransferase
MKDAMAGVLDQLVEKLQRALGGDLVSVVLYGSAVSGDHHGKFSDYNVLCVLTRVTPVQLRATEPLFRWWREQGNPSPLLFTEEELRNATDCFPIEFHDIRDHNKILYGADVVSGMEIPTTFYRAQVEHDLRAKLLRLRQKASGILSDKDVLRRLLIDSVSTFCILFRHALTLSGTEVSGGKREIVRAAGVTFGFDPKPFDQLLDLREQKAKAKDLEPEALLGSYMQQIEVVIGAVDRMARNGEATD